MNVLKSFAIKFKWHLIGLMSLALFFLYIYLYGFESGKNRTSAIQAQKKREELDRALDFAKSKKDVSTDEIEEIQNQIDSIDHRINEVGYETVGISELDDLFKRLGY